MFCSSLRKRSEWSSVPATLLSTNHPRWQERTFETHDLVIPLPQQNRQDSTEFFYMILLSSTDVQPPSTAMPRIDRLYHSNGGRHIGVIFLLNERLPNGRDTINLMNLQANLGNLEVPIIPLFTLSSLQQTLLGFQRQLIHARSTIIHPVDSVLHILPYCSTGRLSEHVRNILSDICHSIPDLAQAATTPDGRQVIRQYLMDKAPEAAEDIIGFWDQEFLVE